MSVSIFQPTINVSTVNPLSAFPAPIAPDIFECKPFYSTPSPPLAADCRTALGKLQTGTTPVPWWKTSGEGRENVLPIKVDHGTCQILFHVSGEAKRWVDPAYIVPNRVRDMAGWLISRCVYGAKGGYITKGLANPIKWLVDPDTDFQQDDWPEDSIFYSLQIRPTTSLIPDDWNPGDFEKPVGDVVLQKVKAAYEAVPASEVAKVDDFAWRYEYIECAVNAMTEGKLFAWWDRAFPLAEPGAGNLTRGGSACYGGLRNVTVA